MTGSALLVALALVVLALGLLWLIVQRSEPGGELDRALDGPGLGLAVLLAIVAELAAAALVVAAVLAIT